MKYGTFIRASMRTLNYLTIVLICVVLQGTLLRATEARAATQLLISLGRVPQAPWLYTLTAMLGYAALLIASACQRRHGNETNIAILLGCVELAASLLTVLALHMAFASVMLIVAIDVEQTLRGRTRNGFLVVTIALYALSSLNIVRNALGIIPFENYLSYYSTFTANSIRDVLTLMTMLNIVGFISATILLLSQKMDENDKIRQFNDQLVVMNEQLKTYAKESEKAAETRERNRLAREIHDTLGHALTGIASASDACGIMLDSSPDSARKMLQEIGCTARQGLVDVRRSVNALRPDALEHHELTTALRAMTERITQTTSTKVAISLPTERLSLSEDEENTIYHIVQEGITNAIRHGNASHIEIQLVADDQTCAIQVKDDGRGMPKDSSEGFGLLHMRERLSLLGGTLSYANADGFVLRASIPIRKGESAK